MRVQIDKPGRDNTAGSIDRLRRLNCQLPRLCDFHDRVTLYSNICRESWRPRAINNGAVLDDEIEHLFVLSCTCSNR